MKFIDEAKIELIAGKGGDGCASMRREKFIPFGGPNGGDGGRGGSIYALAQANINTLIDYHFARRHIAAGGQNGRSSDCYGAFGADKILTMPVGTLIRDATTGEVLADLQRDGEKICLARGGQGGLGNLHFKSSINRAPRTKTNGEPGEHKFLNLELQILADVGLLGVPNAGKSTLLRAISHARPKVADYPFTTLRPYLGVVRLAEEKSFVMADIPGLIPGAADGAGLGLQFLRHIRRTRLLFHLVDVAPYEGGLSPLAQVEQIFTELQKYDAQLATKERWLVFNKIDLLENPEAQVAQLVSMLAWQGKVFMISALTGKGCEQLCFAAWHYLSQFHASSS